MYLMNCFRYLLVSSLLLTGQLPTLSTLHWSSEFLFDSLAYCTGISDGLLLELGYIRDRLPAYSFVLRARSMVLTGERTLSDTSGARQYCPRARQTAPDNYVYGLSGVLKNRLQRAPQRTDWDAKLHHSPGMPAAENHKLVMRHQTTSFPMQLQDGTTVPQ
jgi:hypothetical protein